MKRSSIFLATAILSTVPAQCQVDERLKLIRSITLPGLHDGTFDHFEVDLSGQRLFLTAEDMYSKNALGVINREKRTAIATWPIEPEGCQNIHVSFDEAKHRLYVSSISRRDPAKVNRFYVAVNHHGTTDAKVHVYGVVQ